MIKTLVTVLLGSITVVQAGVCHGTDTGWHRNGQMEYQGEYSNGQQVGMWRWWDEAGKVTSAKTFPEPTP